MMTKYVALNHGGSSSALGYPKENETNNVKI